MNEISINKLSDDLLNDLKDNANMYRLKISKNTLFVSPGTIRIGLKFTNFTI